MGLAPGLSGVQGCDSVLPGEKVEVEVEASLWPQPDSTEDSRSTMLDRHSRLEAPAGLSAGISADRKPERLEKKKKKTFLSLNPGFEKPETARRPSPLLAYRKPLL